MNNIIIDIFNLLINQTEAEYLNAQVNNEIKEIELHKYRLKAFKNAIKILKKINFEIKSSQDLKKYPGLGKGILRRIDEIINTGKLSELKNKYSSNKQKKIDSIQELEKIFGIGKSIASKLIKKYKITSVEELKKAIKNNELKVNSNILLGLKYYGIVEENIPRNEIEKIEKFLNLNIKKINIDLKIIICGSYRRGKKTSGDIDVLLYHPKIINSDQIINSDYLEELIKLLTKKKFLLDHLTNKNYKIKYMGYCKYENYPVRRIDIRYIPYNSLYSAMLYFTGPYELNIIMRKKAEKRKMILNEYGLYKLDNDGNKMLIKINSEKEIFELLGMKYLKPEERENYSE